MPSISFIPYFDLNFSRKQFREGVSEFPAFTSTGITPPNAYFWTIKNQFVPKVKSVTLLKAGEDVPQPERIVLNGAKLGSIRDKAYIDDDFAINWTKGNYTQCGWRLDKLEGEILEVKVSATDAPLRFRVRDIGTDNETSWLDDGTHVFRINLKTKKMESNGRWKDSEWNKSPKPFDFSKGCEIVLEAANGVFTDGKKTVVEYIKVE